HHRHMSVFPEYSSDSSPPDAQPPESSQGISYRTVAGWAAALVLTAVAVVVAIWQVNAQLYTPQATAEHYWESLASADGSEALGQFADTPAGLQQAQLDHVLLDGT